MTDALKFDLSTVSLIPDPTTESRKIFHFDQAQGQNGRPFVFMVEDPSNKTRARHHHHEDVLYVYVKGEHHIDGEGTYRAGDLRWTRAGHVYGPETTGPDGAAWWVVSYGDPTPIEFGSQPDTYLRVVDDSIDRVGGLPHFARPYDWDAIDRAVRTTGGAIVDGLLSEQKVGKVNGQIDQVLGVHSSATLPATGSSLYDLFLGHKTLRLHGLIEKFPAAIDLVARSEIVPWAERMIGARAASILLNAGELI